MIFSSSQESFLESKRQKSSEYLQQLRSSGDKHDPKVRYSLIQRGDSKESIFLTGLNRYYYYDTAYPLIKSTHALPN